MKQIQGPCYDTLCTVIGEDKEREIMREVKQNKWARDKAIANAAVGGKLWNSFGSRKQVQDQLKVSILSFAVYINPIIQK